MSDLLDAALALLPRTVILRDGAKAPLRERWTTHQETRETLTAHITAHPGANIGCRCGAGLVVLDIDPRHDGYQALAVLEANHGHLPLTPRVLTGGGGEHLYFREPYPLRSTDLLPGLELKAAGTQVVAPPSLHPDTGRAYAWDPARTLGTMDVALLPSEVAAMTRRDDAAIVSDDPLNRLRPTLYIRVLTGREVDRNGFVRCPFHAGGNERTPSLYAYPEGGWKCFGCGAGGRIYQFAGLLAGYVLPITREERAQLRSYLRTEFPTS